MNIFRAEHRSLEVILSAKGTRQNVGSYKKGAHIPPFLCIPPFSKKARIFRLFCRDLHSIYVYIHICIFIFQNRCIFQNSFYSSLLLFSSAIFFLKSNMIPFAHIRSQAHDRMVPILQNPVLYSFFLIQRATLYHVPICDSRRTIERKAYSRTLFSTLFFPENYMISCAYIREPRSTVCLQSRFYAKKTLWIQKRGTFFLET